MATSIRDLLQLVLPEQTSPTEGKKLPALLQDPEHWEGISNLLLCQETQIPMMCIFSWDFTFFLEE